MLYIKTTAKYKSPEEKDRIRRAKSAERENGNDEFSFPILEKSEDFYRDIDKKAFFAVSHVTGEFVRMVSIVENMNVFNRYFLRFAKGLNLGLDLENAQHEELTFQKFSRTLSNSSRNGYIISDSDILTDFNADNLSHPWARGVEMEEEILDPISKAESYEKSEKYLTAVSLKEELNRIYDEESLKKKHLNGNPCHYIIQSSDHSVIEDNARILMSSLYNAGRIKNRRCSILCFSEGASWSSDALNYIFRSAGGGAVIIDLQFNAEEDGEYAGNYRDIIGRICATVRKYRNDALAIFCMSKENDLLKSAVFERLSGISFVEIEDTVAFGDVARDYLKNLAREDRVKPDKKLLAKVEEGQGYVEKELKALYDDWVDQKMKASYPQYKQTKTARAKVAEEKPKGSAYDELMALEGLDEAKAVIKKAVDFYRAQKIFSDRGVKVEPVSMSCAFVGNAGSGKSSVAALYAKILKELGILSSGHVTFVSRSQICGKYVGHTAAQVKELFDKSVNGMLVIDEAYSLCIESGGFGEEALAEICNQQSIHAKDVCVIYCGYKKEMEEFINSNPGIKSRISYTVPFSDYSVESLVKIAGYIAGKKGYSVSEGGKEKLAKIFEITSRIENNGNARNALNVVTNAIYSHSSRIVNAENVDKLTKEELLTLTEEDLEMPAAEEKDERKVIGFCA